MNTDVTKWNFCRLFNEVIRDRTTLLNWCQLNGLLPVMKICPEGHVMNLIIHGKGSKRTGVGLFECRKKHVTSTYFRISILRNTFFQGTNLQLEKLMILTYCFTCHDFNNADCIHESSIFNKTTSPETIADWHCYCRELITDFLLKFREYNGKLGGQGVVIEVQQWEFKKRRFVGDLVNEMRAVGIVENTSSRFYVIHWPSNEQDPRVLFQTIEEHVDYGSTIAIKNPEIYQDMSKDYNFADEMCKPSLSKNSAMSNQLQTALPHPSTKMIPNCCKTFYGDYMLEYLWRREMKMTNTDAFDYFLGIVRCQYPV